MSNEEMKPGPPTTMPHVFSWCKTTKFSIVVVIVAVVVQIVCLFIIDRSKEFHQSIITVLLFLLALVVSPNRSFVRLLLESRLFLRVGFGFLLLLIVQDLFRKLGLVAGLSESILFGGVVLCGLAFAHRYPWWKNEFR